MRIAPDLALTPEVHPPAIRLERARHVVATHAAVVGEGIGKECVARRRHRFRDVLREAARRKLRDSVEAGVAIRAQILFGERKDRGRRRTFIAELRMEFLELIEIMRKWQVLLMRDHLL